MVPPYVDALIEEIRAAAEGACVTVEYSLEAKVDDARIKDEGVVVAQDDLWILDGQTVDIYTSKDVTLIMIPSLFLYSMKTMFLQVLLVVILLKTERRTRDIKSMMNLSVVRSYIL